MKRVLLTIFLLVLPIFAQAGEAVRCVQDYLTHTAFDPGPVDGAWGRKTATALSEFAQQAGITIEGGLEKGNVEEVCRVFGTDSDGTLQAMGKYRVFPVVIDKKHLADIDPKFFDLSGLDIYDGPDLQCSFEFRREGPENNGKRYVRAEGNAMITNGKLVFQRHKWSLGFDQLADQSLLKERSNLFVLKTGQVVGRTPYFWSYIQEGGVSKRPVNATLSTHYEVGNNFPDGATIFEIPQVFDMKGVFVLQYCY
jgi:hypothetical protein